MTRGNGAWPEELTENLTCGWENNRLAPRREVVLYPPVVALHTASKAGPCHLY